MTYDKHRNYVPYPGGPKYVLHYISAPAAQYKLYSSRPPFFIRLHYLVLYLVARSV